MFEKGNCILLLFAWSIDVHKEQRDVMTTDHGHQASVIKEFAISRLLLSLGSMMRIFAIIDS